MAKPRVILSEAKDPVATSRVSICLDAFGVLRSAQDDNVLKAKVKE
jgi:hypothetical protein